MLKKQTNYQVDLLYAYHTHSKFVVVDDAATSTHASSSSVHSFGTSFYITTQMQTIHAEKSNSWISLGR